MELLVDGHIAGVVRPLKEHEGGVVVGGKDEGAMHGGVVVDGRCGRTGWWWDGSVSQ